MLDPMLTLTIALALAALFGVSLAQKLLALAEWPGVVRNYRLAPDAFAGAAGATVLVAEGLTVAALIWPPARPAGGSAAAALLACYALAIGINLARGRSHIDCGCSGSRLAQRIAPWMVWRNIALALVALSLLLPARARVLTIAEVGAAVALVATLAFLYPVLAVVARPAPPTFAQNFHASARARASR